MKHIAIYLLSVCFLLPFRAIGQTQKTVTLTYNATDFSLTATDGETHVSSTVHNISFDSDTLAPALPYIGVNVLVSADAEYLGHTLASTEVMAGYNILMAHNPNVIPTGSVVPRTVSGSPVYTESVYPANMVEYAGSHIMGGHKFLSFSVCPFRYDAANRVLYLKNSITLNITLGTETPTMSVSQNPAIKESVCQLVVNPDEMGALYGDASSRPRERTSGNYLYSNSPCKYLIITCDSLKDELQRLADWKTQKGVKAMVMTVEDIYSNYTGNSQQQKIKQAIKDCYDTSNQELFYVLLAGDTDIVPTQLCHAEYNPRSNSLYSEEIASDYYYASLKTIAWNTGSNGIYGPLDLSHDVIVSRLPVTDNTNASQMIDRILNYERGPETDGWEDNILMCGVYVGNYFTINGEVISDAHHTCERMYSNYIADNWTGTKYRLYDTGSDLEPDSFYQRNVTETTLQRELAKGYTFANVCTHGNYNVAWKMEIGLYERMSAYNLENTRNTIITTLSCNTNDFSSGSSLGEAFMLGPKSNILAYYGSSNYNFISADSTVEGYGDEYVGRFYRNLLTSRHHQLARSVYDSKETFAMGYWTYAQACRWMTLAMNLLGDPEMPVFLSRPMQMENVAISSHNGCITVTTGLDSCRICVQGITSGADSLYFVADDVSGISENLPMTSFSVCVTKPGYIPYVYTYGANVYLQNKTISGNGMLAGTRVEAGSDVTPLEQTGPVVIERGSTKLHGTEEVLLKNDFTVKKGATLEITTGN